VTWQIQEDTISFDSIFRFVDPRALPPGQSAGSTPTIAGGAIQINSSPGRVHINGSTFIGNSLSGKGTGGAVGVSWGTGEIIITRSAFLRNRVVGTAKSPTNAQGGGLYVRGSAPLLVVGSAFIGNLATWPRTTYPSGTGSAEGGAMYIGWSAQVTRLVSCLFTANAARGFLTLGTAAIYAQGGAVRSEGSTLTTVRCTFVNNTAESWQTVIATASNCRAHGGAINANAGTTTLNLTTLIGNSARSHMLAHGGALYIWSAIGDFAVLNCTFRTNSATGISVAATEPRGGAVWLSFPSATYQMTINGSLFDNNRVQVNNTLQNAWAQGGGLYLSLWKVGGGPQLGQSRALA
jgi:hypothetical protein